MPSDETGRVVTESTEEIEDIVGRLSALLSRAEEPIDDASRLVAFDGSADDATSSRLLLGLTDAKVPSVIVDRCPSSTYMEVPPMLVD